MTSDVNRYFEERCPKCGSKDIQRSRRKNIVDFALSLLFRPWRCTICFTRFYRPRWLKALPRRNDIVKRFDSKGGSGKGSASAAPAGAGDAVSGSSLSASKETAPGIVKRNPVLGFFPARHEVGNMQDAVPFRAEQLGSRPIQ